MNKIGLEVHCRLDTKTKLFCGCSSASQRLPNTSVCPVCMGFPGYKPRINRKAIEYAICIASALSCDISSTILLSRKTYFYPDMSKNFQITQFENPLGKDGHLMVRDSIVSIRDIHIEEDPAKIIYSNGNINTTEYVLVDYNRSGLPLVEIVTEPDIRDPNQAELFLKNLSHILEYIGVFKPNAEASIRVDANISTENNNRVEIKNITGFNNVKHALEYEIIRQRSSIRIGIKIPRETRHFDETTNTTTSMRKKESYEDYGYIIDTNLPMINVTKELLKRVRDGMPETPESMMRKLVEHYKIKERDAKVMVYTDRNIPEFFEKCCKIYENPETVARWIINYLLKSLNWRSEQLSESKVIPETFVEFLHMIDGGIITERYAKELIKEYVDTGINPKELFYRIHINTSIEDVRDAVVVALEENQKAAKEVLEGKQKAVQYLVGIVLKRFRNQVDPKLIIKLIKKNASIAQ